MKNSPIQVVYVPSHLYHMLFELFKNSMRAVMEFHGEKDKIPPVTAHVSAASEDVCIKVAPRFNKNTTQI